MTSANRGGSPIVFRDADLSWIDGLADAVLGHDRPIHVPCEDSVIVLDDRGEQMPVRRSRGYAPLPVRVSIAGRTTPVILATGGDLKTTFCLMGRAVDGTGQAHLSSHLGDMSDPRTQACFTGALDHLAFMTDRRPAVIACDRHPGYATTRWAERYADGRPVVAVQHHHAHAVSLLAERGRLGTPMLAVAYDGTGYGTDGSIWGGELSRWTIRPPSPGPGTSPRSLSRAATVPSGSPPGSRWTCCVAPGSPGSRTCRPSGRSGRPDFTCWRSECRAASSACRPPAWAGCSTRSPACSACCQQVSYEGQAAVELEHLARRGSPAELDFAVSATVMDPIPVIAGIVEGLRTGADPADLAAGFHPGGGEGHRRRGRSRSPGGRDRRDRSDRRGVRQSATAERPAPESGQQRLRGAHSPYRSL